MFATFGSAFVWKGIGMAAPFAGIGLGLFPDPNDTLLDEMMSRNELGIGLFAPCSHASEKGGLFGLLSQPAETDPAFHVYEDRAGEFRWNLKAGNHEKMASGESYTRREDAVRAISRLKQLVAISGIRFD